jgi:hypothetical protein
VNLSDDDYWLEISLYPAEGERREGYSSGTRLALSEVLEHLPYAMRNWERFMPSVVANLERELKEKKQL